MASTDTLTPVTERGTVADSAIADLARHRATPTSHRRSTASDDLPTDLPAGAGRAAAGIALVLVAQFMLMLDATVVNVALPSIDADLGFSAAGLSWVLNGYTLAFGGLLLLGGRLGDVLGRRRMLEVGVGLFTLGSLLGAVAQSPGVLIGSRALQGVGAAIAAPGVLALLTTTAPDEAARNRALALFSAVVSGAMSVGLLLGGALTDLGSWRWTMLINVPVGLAVLALTRQVLDETPRRPGRFDLVGAATATLGSLAIVWSLIGAPDHGWTSARTVVGLVVGLALIAALVVTERRVAHPMVRPGLLRHRPRVGALVVMGITLAGMMSTFFLTVQLLEGQFGYGPMRTGLAFLPLAVAVFAMSRLTPTILARVGAWPMIATGTAGLAVGFAWLSQVGVGDGYLTSVFGPLLTIGLSAGLTFMPVTSTVLGGVEPEHAGAASGLLQTAQQLGGAVGLAVVASVYAAHTLPGQVLPGLEPALLTSAGFAATAVVVALTVVRPRRLRSEGAVLLAD